MKDILDFLAASPAFHVGTVDADNKPRVRPFSLVFEWNGRLTFGTNDTKPVYEQLMANPYVEISSFDHNNGEWMRISGRVEIFRDKGAFRRIFEVMPALKAMYGDENNPVMVCFSIVEGQAAVYSFASGTSDPICVTELK